MNYESTVAPESGAVMTLGEQEAAAEQARRRRFAIIAVVAAVVLMALLYFFIHHGSDEAGELAAPPAGQVPVVSVVQPGHTTIDGEIEATGTLAARREIPVSSVGEGGRVVSVPVDEGDWVRKGQVMVVIDRSVQVQQVAGARAQVGVMQANLNLAQANLDRGLKLVDRGFISKADIDRLTSTRDSAAAQLQASRASLAELQARTARLNILAPEGGLVLTRNVEPGQTVGAGGSPLFTIAKHGEMELNAMLGEEDLAKVHVGSLAKVIPVSSGQTFSGQVWQIAPTIDAQSRQGEARIALAYAPGLRPGGFASATLSSGTVSAPLLPESAIMTDTKGNYVFVVGKDDKVQRRAVTTGLVTATGIAVTSGLTGSERIVLRAGGFLNPGDKIKPELSK
ncbi:efflux RND transporter periplasmic adaptor subunit [Tsuneonella mangrovi]|uniref:efflux RND transporter periplasmic adaptor subunit n=1 Tax=Tsuneonella mangrovi TaxID=1982042 RepID=UPI000BA229A0|nr:efflux RND transporter periplasmic adaptor subunit [Tsuneonella mangrovi]